MVCLVDFLTTAEAYSGTCIAENNTSFSIVVDESNESEIYITEENGETKVACWTLLSSTDVK